jgi:hypothetical protein
MTKNPAQSRSVPPPKPAQRPRGRPPRPGGPIPQADVQRAYRARLKATGKVLKLVDADAVADLAMLDRLRERLHNALSKLERREQDVARLTTRNAYLEGELKRLEQHHTNALKEIVVLKQKTTAPARARPRAKCQRQRDG